ncbi:hypothetical protein M9H77_34576 [Catharanthus roseus]|uniref:Uncharacterized protein n=1 Tax=Catharanthus roseus TaxID=4058 RepID=A0ACB9ZMS9_CATRO|nr:hypothetical protein M9H77_34576 [Catharanthus roseus]
MGNSKGKQEMYISSQGIEKGESMKPSLLEKSSMHNELLQARIRIDENERKEYIEVKQKERVEEKESLDEESYFLDYIHFLLRSLKMMSLYKKKRTILRKMSEQKKGVQKTREMVRTQPESLSESRHIGAAMTPNFQTHSCTMIGSTDRVRNLKRSHRTQVPASRSQYQSETQSTLYERLIFHKPPYTPLIHKLR